MNFSVEFFFLLRNIFLQFTEFSRKFNSSFLLLLRPQKNTQSQNSIGKERKNPGVKTNKDCVLEKNEENVMLSQSEETRKKIVGEFHIR